MLMLWTWHVNSPSSHHLEVECTWIIIEDFLFSKFFLYFFPCQYLARVRQVIVIHSLFAFVPYTSNFNRQLFFLFPCLVHKLFERIFNVNDKSIVHIVVLKPLECFISIINWNSLNYGCHTLFTTKTKHLLHLLNPANHASSNCLQSYRSNYQMGKKTSMFAYTSSVSSSVLRVAYQKLQQIWCQHFESDHLWHGKSWICGYVDLFTYPWTIVCAWTSSRGVQQQLQLCPHTSKVISMDQVDESQMLYPQ